MHQISAQLSVSAVPTVAFLKRGDMVDKLEGFDPVALSTKAAALAGKPEDLTQRMEALVKREPVMLFIKGTPEVPRCGFSRKVVEAFKHAGVPFGTYDILSDEEVRGRAATLCWCVVSRFEIFNKNYNTGRLGLTATLQSQHLGV